MEDILIPIFGIVGVFGMPVFIVWIVYYFSSRSEKQFHQTLQELIKSGIEEFDKAENSMENINIQDKSLIFNTDLTEALELYNLTAQSKVTLHSALNRKETRGAHAREDYSERDDENWLVHSLAWLTKKGEVKLGARPVHMNTLTNHVQSIPPKKRVY